MTHRTPVFFYGSYISFDVLAKFDIDKRDYRVVRLPGYELTIGPLANLVSNPDKVTYGILIDLSHGEIDRLYAKGVLAGAYLPEAVLVQDLDGGIRPAMTYISYDLKPDRANPAYVANILESAKAYNFPQWFMEHIRLSAQ